MATKATKKSAPAKVIMTREQISKKIKDVRKEVKKIIKAKIDKELLPLAVDAIKSHLVNLGNPYRLFLTTYIGFDEEDEDKRGETECIYPAVYLENSEVRVLELVASTHYSPDHYECLLSRFGASIILDILKAIEKKKYIVCNTPEEFIPALVTKNAGMNIYTNEDDPYVSYAKCLCSKLDLDLDIDDLLE